MTAAIGTTPRKPHVGAVMEAVLRDVRELAGEGGWARVGAVVAHLGASRMHTTPAQVNDAINWCVRLALLERNGPELVRIARNGGRP